MAKWIVESSKGLFFKYNLNYHFFFLSSVHEVKSECSDRRIPLLREVFESFPDLAINVDVKTNNDRLIHEVRRDDMNKE